MPKSKTPRKPKPLYRAKPPPPERGIHSASTSPAKAAQESSSDSQPRTVKRTEVRAPSESLAPARPLSPAHFELREDGTIAVEHREEQRAPVLTFSDPARSLWLYLGNCFELLDAIAAKFPEGRFDAIFADPPYFLSNGGITCHAGKMVKVDKGDWDQSQGADENHNFNREWLARCQRVLNPNGTIWVSGTHHVIFSIGFAMQQLGFKILNDIPWEKPNPPPNLSCRYFTPSTETILWAAKNEKSRHVFNYQEMRKVTGKQMKTVWRKQEFEGRAGHSVPAAVADEDERRARSDAPYLQSIWTLPAPGNGEKAFGKHPTQKPVALVDPLLRTATFRSVGHPCLTWVCFQPPGADARKHERLPSCRTRAVQREVHAAGLDARLYVSQDG